MRKLIALLTILILAGPALGFACNCCPMNSEKSSSTTTLSSPDCNCCTDSIDVKGKRQGVQQELRLFASSIFSRTFQSVLAIAVSRIGIFDFERFSFALNPVGPPGSPLHAPLYLTLQILRI